VDDGFGDIVGVGGVVTQSHLDPLKGKLTMHQLFWVEHLFFFYDVMVVVVLVVLVVLVVMMVVVMLIVMLVLQVLMLQGRHVEIGPR